jgi:H/ACA ribonucleoprotein complex subunit 3
MTLIKKCPKCGKYTLKGVCCEGTKTPHPPKFASENRYGKYRRIAKIKYV